jgi:hypothetical protein
MIGINQLCFILAHLRAAQPHSVDKMEVGVQVPPSRQRLFMIGAALVPLVFFTLYLIASRWPTRWFSSTSDYLGLAVAETGGVICIWRVIAHPVWRLVVSLMYLLVCTGILILFGFGFVCGVFGDCL